MENIIYWQWFSAVAWPSSSGYIRSTFAGFGSGSGVSGFSVSFDCIKGLFGNMGGSFGVRSLIFLDWSSSLDVVGPNRKRFSLPIIGEALFVYKKVSINLCTTFILKLNLVDRKWLNQNQIKINLRLFDSFVYTSSSLNEEIMSMRKYCKTPVKLTARVKLHGFKF